MSENQLKIGDFRSNGGHWPKISGRRGRAPSTILLLRSIYGHFERGWSQISCAYDIQLVQCLNAVCFMTVSTDSST